MICITSFAVGHATQPQTSLGQLPSFAFASFIWRFEQVDDLIALLESDSRQASHIEDSEVSLQVCYALSKHQELYEQHSRSRDANRSAGVVSVNAACFPRRPRPGDVPSPRRRRTTAPHPVTAHPAPALSHQPMTAFERWPSGSCIDRAPTELMPAPTAEPRSFPAFPHEPYSIQLDFMRALYDTIDAGGVGLFESPTGEQVVFLALAACSAGHQ